MWRASSRPSPGASSGWPLALAFNGWLWSAHGPQRGLEFLTAYLIEKALAVDNIFVFVVIFLALAVPAAYQHRVLFWGILGALVMRGTGGTWASRSGLSSDRWESMTSASTTSGTRDRLFS